MAMQVKRHVQNYFTQIIGPLHYIHSIIGTNYIYIYIQYYTLIIINLYISITHY